MRDRDLVHEVTRDPAVAAAPRPDPLETRLARERKAREEAERISERAIRALYDKQQELSLLESVAAAANEASSLEDALQVAVDRVCTHTGWPLGHAYLRSEDSGMLVPTTIWHADEGGDFEPFVRVTERTTFVTGEGLPGRVLESGAPAWIEDVTGDVNFPRAEAAELSGLRGAFGFPILVGRVTEGVMEFFTDRRAEPDAPLLHVMAQIGTQLGRLVERSRAQERIAHQATHDAVTGLPNRVLFLDRLRHALERSRRDLSATAVLFIDLDRFKIINDTFGHSVGDRLLEDVGKRLRGCLRPSDTVARFGGDEFVVLCEALTGEQQAIELVERLQRGLSNPFALEDTEHALSGSIGLAVTTDPDHEAEGLVRDADSAMYRAKECGRARFELYDDAMRARALERFETERALRRALENGELRVHYQPIVSLGSRRIAAIEALLRWEHPTRGLLTPGDFLEVAEDSGLILPIGAWVMREACRQATRWRAHFGPMAPVPVSVNLSARQLAVPQLPEVVEQALRETGCAAGDLAVELTETVLIENARLPVAILDRLKAIGVHILLDDFGTGYSSLSYLQRFPVDMLKVDGGFVRELGHGRRAEAIVAAIAGMGRALGMTVIAECVETADQAAVASELGCDLAQGYHFARPAPAGQIGMLIDRDLGAKPPKRST